MIISFFSQSRFSTWVDQSSHPDLIYQEDREINLNHQIPRLIQNEEGYHIEMDDLPPAPETHDQKVARVSSLLISEEDYEAVDTEWLTRSDLDRDHLILSRFFGWDRGAEIWFTQRMIYLTLNRSEDQDEEYKRILAWYEAKEKYKNYLKSI